MYVGIGWQWVFNNIFSSFLFLSFLLLLGFMLFKIKSVLSFCFDVVIFFIWVFFLFYFLILVWLEIMLHDFFKRQSEFHDLYKFERLIRVSWPVSVWNVNTSWHWSFFYTNFSFQYHHLTLKLLKIELCDFFHFSLYRVIMISWLRFQVWYVILSWI